MNQVMDNELNMGWNFDNSYTSLPSKLYTRINLNRVASPNIVIINKALAKSLGLNVNTLENDSSINVFAGNEIPSGGELIAQAYAGHQFGYFTMLGDGRALLIGEHITPSGERYDIQLKGSGKTPYSRGGDGRAALGPMLREYIISEALFGLEIPTTRSLAVVTTGEKIVREDYQIGAILTRVASSHIRVGTFQYISAYGNIEELRRLAEYTIKRHYPHIMGDENKFLSFLREVISRQAELVSKWQLVGFVHGVMNTDNMFISGESMDFGPCAFMDIYNPKTVFSSIDREGRYSYGNQPDMAAWNLARFADTLIPLIHHDQEIAIKMATEEIENFYNLYDCLWLNGMRSKLGLFHEEPKDRDLIDELLNIMYKYKADFINTFRFLTIEKTNEMELFNTDEFINWKTKWDHRLIRQSQNKTESKKLMKDSNPSVIPRNHKVEEAIDAVVTNGDLSIMIKLLDILSNPYSYTEDQEEYSVLPPVTSRPYKTFCGT